MEQPLTQTEIPAAPMSLREHIALETRTEAPAQAATAVAEPVAPAESPEQEASSVKPDAELSEAARVLRKNRASERKAQIQREIAEAVRERNVLREEVARFRSEREQFAREAQPARPATAPRTAADPNDPEPALEQFADAPDPYSAYIDAKARWATRQEHRALQQKAHETRQRGEVERTARETASQLESLEAKAREKYEDFDAVMVSLTDAYRGHPAGDAIARAVAQSKVGEDLAYYLGTHPDEVQSAVKGGPSEFFRVIGRIEASLSAPPKETPKPITKAPAPPAQTVGAHATAHEVDTRKGVPLKDHIRIEEAEIAERRRQGYRY